MEAGGTCYSYEVIESVCVAVQFSPDPETSTYGWKYVGGCFEDGRVNNYKWATPGTEYVFDKLDFEVREYNGDNISGDIGKVFGYISLVFLIIAIVAGLRYICLAVVRRVKGKGKNTGSDDSSAAQDS